MNNNFEKCINEMDNCINWLNKLMEENPEEAKMIVRLDLIRIGIIDEEGNLKYLYNSDELVNGDFSRGPKYNCRISESQTVSELVRDLDNKTQVRIRK